jgi:hypothetical protein
MSSHSYRWRVPYNGDAVVGESNWSDVALLEISNPRGTDYIG